MNPLEILYTLVDGVNREAAALIGNQPDPAGRVAVGERLNALVSTALVSVADNGQIDSQPVETEGTASPATGSFVSPNGSAIDGGNERKGTPK